MGTFWIVFFAALALLAAVLPDDAAIAIDLVDVWLRAARVWLASRLMMARLWLRLKWDGSQIAWRLWLIRRRAAHNRNNEAKGN
jgi:hypothetical protein